MPAFSIRNFGCRVNQAEAFRWAEDLKDKGFRLEDDPALSDVILVNSCTLTARADRDVRKFVRKAARDYPRARVVLTGCYAERAGEEIGKIGGAALVVPNGEKDSIPGRIATLLQADGTAAPGTDRSTGYGNGHILRPGGNEPEPQGGNFEDADASYRSRALVKIQDGCGCRCTFCVIPSVRGQSASMPEDEILERVRGLAGQGYKEIVLAGIHLSSYGEDREPRGSLLGLLGRLGKIDGLGRIRLSSLDPRRMDANLIGHITGNPKICPHFHLSLQHASERILRAMGRPIRPGLYEGILSALRKRSPEAGIGADVIVGFPGEEDGDFRILRDFLERSPLTYFHVFSYSPRDGTPAAGMSGQVPESVKKERAGELRRMSAEKNLRFRRSLEGGILDAVVIRTRPETANGRGIQREVEAPAEPGVKHVELLTGNYIKVLAVGPEVRERDLVRVRITRTTARATDGEIVCDRFTGPDGI